MNAYQTVNDMLLDNKVPGNKLLALAYLQGHMLEPALHPDDYLFRDGGYPPNLAVITFLTQTRIDPIEELLYPVSLLQLQVTVDRALTLIATDGMREKQAKGLLSILPEFMKNFNVHELQQAISYFEGLVLFFTDEEPAETFETCAHVLRYINGL